MGRGEKGGREKGRVGEGGKKGECRWGRIVDRRGKRRGRGRRGNLQEVHKSSLFSQLIINSE